MANKMPHSRQTPTAVWGVFSGCFFAPFVIIAIPVCLFCAWLFGVTDDISSLIKSLEFPAIEARYKAIADRITATTSDELIEETHSINHMRFITHLDRYTGSVGGDIKKILGTNRSFDAVWDDYVRFLSSSPEWKVDPGGYFLAHNKSSTAKVVIKVLDKTEGYTSAWDKYHTVYKVWLIFGEPHLWEG